MNNSPPVSTSTKTKTKVSTVILQAITKGAVRYQEVDRYESPLRMNDPLTLIGTLYLRQSRLKDWENNRSSDIFPRKLKITIEVID